MGIGYLIGSGLACLVLFRRVKRSVITESSAHQADWRHDVGALFVLAICMAVFLMTSVDLSSATSLTLGICSGMMATQTIIDMTTRRLPLYVSLMSAILMFSAAAIADRSVTQLLAMITGGLTMMVIARVLVLFSRGSLGRGDVYFCLPLGFALGVNSTASATVSLAVYAWLLSAIVGGIVATVGLLLRRFSRASTIPYGPFLVAGTIATIAAQGIQ